MLCLTGYLLWCLEKCIKFITKNAYIQAAIAGTSFCTSAWNAFTLMIKHAARFGWGNSIGAMVVFFGCTNIAALTAFISYIIISQVDTLNVSTPIAPALVCGFIGLIIGWQFMSVYSFASDALLQSFLLDEELKFAGTSRPVAFAEFEKDFKERQKSCCSCC